MNQAPPVALTIAGSDCSSGAGIQADLKTFQHFHVHGLTAVTCVVSESALVVNHVHPVPVEIARDQAALMLSSFPLAAVKTGMLFSAEHVTAIAAVMENARRIPLVVDPVMIASTGAPLLETPAVQAYRERLLPLARVITPNLPEAEALLGREIPGIDALEAAARELAALFGTAVLLKGGHLDGPECVDLLLDHGHVFRFAAPRVETSASHGTGCTLSAAITAGLAHGQALPDAVSAAKQYLGETLRRSYTHHTADGKPLSSLNQGTLWI